MPFTEEKKDNTYVSNIVRPQVLIKRKQAQPTPQVAYLSPDTRADWQKEKQKKEIEAQKYVEEQKKVRQQTGQAMLGIAALGGLAAAQATPAGPYLDALLAGQSGVNLAIQNQEGTLGFNAETALNTLGMIPFGFRMLKKTKTAVDPRQASSTGVSSDRISEYKNRRDMMVAHNVYKTPDVNIIEDNVLREIAWVPNDKISLSSNTFTTVQNAVRRMNEPLYREALTRYLQGLRNSGDIDRLNKINEAIARVEKARTVVNDPDVRHFQGYFAIPDDWASSNGYSFLSDGVAGITFANNGRAKAYVRNPSSMLNTRSTTPLHENEHVYQMLMSSTGNWNDALTPAQKALYNKVYRTLPTPTISASTDIVEKATTNKELQRLIQDMYQREHGVIPNYWQLNKYIDELPNEVLIALFYKPVNGYHSDYLRHYMTEGYKDPNFVKNFRNILKFGPVLATPVLMNNQQKK